MPTYSDEVNVYNPNAIDDAIGEAATTATSYITSVTSDGIMVADANKGASNGSITANTTGWHIGGVLEFIRNGVARFWIGLKNQNDTTPTVRIGKAFVNGATDNESYMELDYHSLQLIDKEGDTYFHVSDLRDADGYLTETFKGNGTTKVFTVSLGVSSVASVKVNNTETSAYTRNGTTFTFTTAPTNGADVAIRYKPATTATKAYTMGKRASGNIGIFSVAEGYGTTASGARSHAEGWNTTASDIDSHAEGHGTTASGGRSHAEGQGTTASGNHSHAEGNDTTASGNNSHAEGSNTTASGDLSHTEGSLTTASGDYSHAEGYSSQAIGDHSHAQNHGTKASSDSQTAIGKFNVEDGSDDYALIVGNGTADDARSNALTVDWNGNIISQAMAGIIQMFAGSTAPSGWLVCDGSAVSRTTYATLFAAIGTTWGTGDGSTTFNLPDLRGRAPIGAGTGSGLTARTLGSTGGSEALQSHDHNAASNGYNVPGKNGGWNWRTTASGSNTNYNNTPMGGSTAEVASITKTGSAGSGNAGNMQPFAVINFIICTGKTS